jgi:DNA-binding LacI/PurR family transcriptional regulator
MELNVKRRTIKKSKPVFKQVQDDIRQAIASNALLPGEIIPSESHLAKKYKVCRTTVRKALDELVRDNVIIKRPGKGAFVRDVKSSGGVVKSVKRMKNIGFVINSINLDSSTRYYAELIDGMQNACSRKGIRLTLVRDEDLDSISDSFLDAIVFMRNFEAVGKLKDRNIPIILVNRFTDEENIGYIAVDYREESCKGVEHLISLGHERIGVIGANLESEVCQWRLNGYFDAMRKNNLSIDKNLLLSSPLSPDIYADIKDFLQKTDATALFVTIASYIPHLSTAVYELSIKVPQELSILCFDDVETAVMHPGAALSSISMPLAEMGEKAVEYLEKKIDDRAYPVLRELVYTDLIIRQSTSQRREC